MKDLTGMRFTRLLVLGFHSTDKHGKPKWNCLCDCGTHKTPGSGELMSGRTKSCGCLKRDRLRKLNSTHRLSNTGVCHSWWAMNHRCNSPNDQDYSLYGGRGIKVCEFIRESPQNLMDCIGERPIKMTVDRIEKNGNYSCGACPECVRMGWPKNIRWSTQREQNRNKNNNLLFTINGETKCCVEWAEITGLSDNTIYYRHKRGWPDDKLLLPKCSKLKIKK